MKHAISLGAVVLALVAGSETATQDAADAGPYLGEIRFFAGTRVPDGWAKCDGRGLDAQANPELLDILRDRYNPPGVGRGSLVYLPDAQGRVLIGAGRGAGLPNYGLGERGGSVSVHLQQQHVPARLPQLEFATTQAQRAEDGGGVEVLAARHSAHPRGGVFRMDPAVTPHFESVDVRTPYLAVTCMIAIEGRSPNPF